MLPKQNYLLQHSINDGISPNANIAVYPYQDGLTCSPVIEDDHLDAYRVVGVNVPSIQTYVEGSFSDEAFLMAAITNGTSDCNLNFKNLCGALKLQLKGTAKIKKIQLSGNDNEPLSGDAIVTIYPDGRVPSLAMSENAATSVTLDCMFLSMAPIILPLRESAVVNTAIRRLGYYCISTGSASIS